MAVAEASVAAGTVLTSVAMRGGGGYGDLRQLWRAAGCGDVRHGVAWQQQRVALPSWLLLLAGGGGRGEGRQQQSHMELKGTPPPKNVEQNILEYVDRKKGTIFLKLTTC